MRWVRDVRDRRVPVRYTRQQYHRVANERRKEMGESWRARVDESSEGQSDAESERGSVRGWILAAPVVVAGMAGVVAGGGVFLAVLVAMAVLPLVLLSRALGLPGAWDAGLPASVGAVVLLVLLVLHVARWHKRSARELVNLSICGACAYRLDALPLSEDGNTECPECGAAWRLPAVESSSCLNCSARLAGLRVDEEGIVWCPQCGAPHGLHAVDTDS